MSGAELVRLIKDAAHAKPPPWAEGSLVKSTRDTHRRMLKWISDMPITLHKLPVTESIIQLMAQLRLARRWTWATTLKNLASAQGALALLPMYRTVEHGIMLKHEVTWTEAMKALTRYAREEDPRTPKAMTPQTFQATLKAESDLQRQVVLAIMWYTSQRVGCVLQLAPADLQWNDDDTLSITFKRGKSVKIRGPYTVHTTNLKAIKPMIQRYVASVQKRRASRLFTLKTAEMLQTFRLVDPALEARSVRRGTLQTMAQKGVPNATLMEYSGHTCERTLLRYLNWGKAAGNARARMDDAGKSLLQG